MDKINLNKDQKLVVDSFYKVKTKKDINNFPFTFSENFPRKKKSEGRAERGRSEQQMHDPPTGGERNKRRQ